MFDLVALFAQGVYKPLTLVRRCHIQLPQPVVSANMAAQFGNSKFGQ
jgi:hypothetical protein